MIMDISAANGGSDNVLFDNGRQYGRTTGGWELYTGFGNASDVETEKENFTYELSNTLHIGMKNKNEAALGWRTKKGVFIGKYTRLKYSGTFKNVNGMQSTSTSNNLTLQIYDVKRGSTVKTMALHLADDFDLTSLYNYTTSPYYQIGIVMTSKETHSSYAQMNIERIWLE